MCRLAFYTGPPQPLSALLYDPPHGLEVQAHAPRELQHGTVNVDGTGLVWWTGDDPTPLRYVTDRPPWSDPNLPSLAPRLTGHTILAAVRGATPGIGHDTALVGPFLFDGLAVVHNGWIGGFRDGVAADLHDRLPRDLASAAVGWSDSVALALLVAAHRRKRLPLADAVQAAVADVVEACVRADQPATLNLVVTDGMATVALRASHRLPGNSLYVLRGSPRWPDGVLVASEPLDDSDWGPVPDGALLQLQEGMVRQVGRLPPP